MKLLLIRHAEHILGGDVLPGRTSGVSLSEAGRRHAAALAQRLADTRIDAFYSSPVQRARETAQILAEPRSLPVRIAEGFTEIDVGRWEGRPFRDLDADDLWRRWNQHRSGTAAPGGELMLETQARVVRAIHALADTHREDVVAVTTHADVIRAATTWALGMPLDLLLRLRIDLCSMTALGIGDDGPTVLGLNLWGEGA